MWVIECLFIMTSRGSVSYFLFNKELVDKLHLATNSGATGWRIPYA